MQVFLVACVLKTTAVIAVNFFGEGKENEKHY